MFLPFVGNSLIYHNNRKFSTYDRDNDEWSRNCAATFHGAWWYRNCRYSNLNGRYEMVDYKNALTGLSWYWWKINFYSMKKTVMKIRPVVTENFE